MAPVDPESPEIETEADADVRAIVPYLAGIGISPNRLRSQRTFALRLGHNVFHAVSGEAQTEATGRLDYLVVDDSDRPLFVVEAKRPDAELTEADRDQGISYARLLTQIAPFVLITNGRDAQLYDTITREQISDVSESSYVRSGYRIVLDDVELRYEALSHFIGYSPANVAAFSRAQIGERMRGLRGEGGDRSRKYLPAAYQRRPDIREKVERFLGSTASLFVLAGASGVGKTNEACAIAEDLSRVGITLFFNGAELYRLLGPTIAEEFAWHFSEAAALPALCRRLAGLARRAGRPALIVVDAIDEVQHEGIELELGELAGHLAGVDGQLKLLVSLKTDEWPRFSLIRGNVSQVVAHCFASEQVAVVRAGPSSHSQPTPSFTLERFGIERDQAVARYNEVFGLTGQWPQALLGAAEDPFVLRLIAEVSAQEGALPASPDEPMLIARYLEQKLAATSDPDRTRAEIIAVARALVRGDDNGLAAGARTVAEHLLHEAGDLRPGIPLGRDAVSYGLLVRSQDHLGRPHFGFAYDRVRHFVVASYVLDALTGETVPVQRTVAAAYASVVGREAVAWCLPYASPSAWGGIIVATADNFEIGIGITSICIDYVPRSFFPCINRYNDALTSKTLSGACYERRGA